MSDEPAMRCHVYRGIHIPGCWGCAAYDHSRCTCPSPPPDTRRGLTRKVEELEARISALEIAAHQGKTP